MFLVAQSFFKAVLDVLVWIIKLVLKSGARSHFVPERSKVLIPHVWGIHSINRFIAEYKTVPYLYLYFDTLVKNPFRGNSSRMPALFFCADTIQYGYIKGQK